MSHKISEAARSTGFSVSALRFYEQESVVVPQRAESGYRLYSDADLDALRFVRRGKRLGLTLEEIRELLTLLEDEDCEPVQTRIRELVESRIARAQDRIADLVGLIAHLQGLLPRLTSHTADGACDEQCGCRSEPNAGTIRRRTEPIPLAGAGSGNIACSLNPELVGARIGDWNQVVADSYARTEVPGGVRLHFAGAVDLANLAELVAAEQECCSFFEFNIGVSADGVTLSVTGPDDAREVIASVFGSAA